MAQACCPKCYSVCQIKPRERGCLRRCAQCGDLFTPFPGERKSTPTPAEAAIPDVPVLESADEEHFDIPVDTKPPRVTLPAVALVFIGVLGVIFGLLVIAGSMNPKPGGTDDTNPAMEIFVFSMGTISSVIVVLAGINMARLSRYKLALFGSVLAMIPCLGPCCGMSMPIGIWAAVVLAVPAVRASFVS